MTVAPRAHKSDRTRGPGGDTRERHPATAETVADAVGSRLELIFAQPIPPGLYLVATPIGNLGDISLRALHILAAADRVFCEDTRHSRKLLTAYGISRRLEAYHDFSGDRDRARVMAALEASASVALISDAGTPLVSDPGFKLVRAAIEHGAAVSAVPGASAAITALISSGLPCDRFLFGGFLPTKDAACSAALDEVLDIPSALVFFDAASRIDRTLRLLHVKVPERQTAIARELTKVHETIARGTPHDLLRTLEEQPPRGEYVVVIAPPVAKDPEAEDVEHALRNALKTASLRNAVAKVSKDLGMGRTRVYNLALKVKDEDNS